MIRRIFLSFIFLAVMLCTVTDLYSSNKTIKGFIAINSPKSFYPNDSADGITSDHLNQIFEHLFWIDNDGNIAPALATEWKRLDDKTLQIKLRRGVLFHNGEKFDSNAVKFSVELFTNTSERSVNRYYGNNISHVDIIDDETINVITTVSDSLLVYKLATACAMIPPDYYQTVGKNYFSKHPIGTGPFKFVSLQPDKVLMLDAFENYWGGKVSIDRLEILYYASVDQATEALIKGDLDFVAHIPGKYSKAIQTNPDLRLVKKLTRQSIVLLLNTKKSGPLQSVDFRKALRDGVNNADVIKYGYNGNGHPTRLLSVRGEPTYISELDARESDWDPSLMKRFLASHDDVKNTKFKMLITKPYDLAGSIVVSQMKALGLDIEATYGSDDDEQNAVLKKNIVGEEPEIDFLLSYCSHRYALGIFPLLVLMHSKGNWSLTSDTKLDELLDKAVGQFDMEEQMQLFLNAIEHIYDDALILPVFQLQDMFGMRNGIDYEPHITGYIYFKDIKKE